MDLRQFLTTIAETYDRSEGLETPAQILLRNVSQHLQHLAPGGYLVIGSGGKGTATFTPWFGYFDPDETVSPQEGLYVAYLFSEDLSHVGATVMQGITALDRALGRRRARSRLAEDADAIRARLARSVTEGLLTTLDLGSGGFRQRAYEAGCVVAKMYVCSNLPGETTLQEDLAQLIAAHQASIVAKRDLLQASPGLIATASSQQLVSEEDPLLNFKPKDDADYVSALLGRVLVKTRRHERLIRQYGEWLAARGSVSLSTTQHPRDLVVMKGPDTWLVEAKVVRLGKATDAVRAALGQLFTYRHFLYDHGDEPRLLALFSESIGGAYVEFLSSHGVASVWYDGGEWVGSSSALETGLAERLEV